ncbi:alanine racemase [Diaminobutyricimonas aerilata]|nr:alanine racemase [Diaminobutyricimonas aerilata]
MTLAPPPTPFVAVEVPVLERNIAARARSIGELGIETRPHAKTHKSSRIARMQLDAGARGITVATIGEAEAFVAGGVDDVFIAYPLWVDPDRGTRLRALAERAEVRIGVESIESAARAAEELRGTGVRVLVEVDSGHHRTGVAASDAGRIARAAADAGLPAIGVFTFPGHSYSPDGRRTAAEQEAAALAEAAASLRGSDIEPLVVSGGSTPSADFAAAGTLTELRPGVYVFGDAQQWELGTYAREQIALTVHATVVSRRADRIVVDAGSKILGADRAAYSTGFGRLLDLPDARITSLSEHHAVVELDGSPAPSLGATVRVVPNHVCSAVNLVDSFVAFDGGRAELWPVDARGRNS